MAATSLLVSLLTVADQSGVAVCALALLGKNQKWLEDASGRCHVTVSRYLRGRDVWPDCRDDISRVLVAALSDAGRWEDGKGIVLPQQGA